MDLIPLVSNIQRFSVDDGPGIRTTAFLKGCNLRCRWCHNPECITPRSTLQFLQNNCRICGKCASVCPGNVHEFTPDGRHLIHRERCISCGACVKVCPTQALNVIGRAMSAEELVAQLIRDYRFYTASGGGVTISGGDPMLFPDYTCAVLKLLKEKHIHTAVDTAGHVPFESFETVLPYADLFLFDVKAFDEALHIKLTDRSNKLILDNLKRLSALNTRFFIRVPVIPTCNADMAELDHISAFLAKLPHPPELTQLLPYHSYGIGKYASIGKESPLPPLQPPSQEWMDKALRLFTDRGLNASVS